MRASQQTPEPVVMSKERFGKQSCQILHALVNRSHEMQGCCARNKRPVTNKVVALNLILCAIPILMTFVGGALLMSTAKPVRRSLNNFVDTGLNQVWLFCAFSHCFSVFGLDQRSSYRSLASIEPLGPTICRGKT
jgi:hypothetical protein